MESPQGKLRIGLLVANSQYGTLRRSTAGLARLLREGGHTATIFDMLSVPSVDDFARHIAARALDVVVAFQGWGLDLAPSGPTLFDATGIPYIAILADNPMHHSARLSRLNARSAVILPDMSYENDVRRLAPALKSVRFLELKEPYDLAEDVPLSARDVPFLFMGSLGDEAKAWAVVERWPGITQALRAMLELRASEHPMRTDEALLHVLSEYNIDRESFGDGVFQAVLSVADGLVRRDRRLRFVRAIKRAPLTIWGSGWPAEIAAKPNVTLLTADHPTGPEAARRARILLNVFPDEGWQGHDRIMLAWATRTPLVSDVTERFLSWIPDGDLRALFVRRASEVDDVVLHALADPELLERVAEAGNAFYRAIPDGDIVRVIESAYADIVGTS